MDLIAGFKGSQLRPGDAGYDEARTLFNAMVDKHPALIAQCTGPEDVAKALAHVRGTGVPVAVRAGGHSVAGMSLCDDGLVIDVRPMKDISVDPVARTARAGAGLTWGEFDRATQEHGLATTGGRVSTTGIAGFTLGGGSGWLERSCGLTCDNLIGAELVTAAGDLIRATEDEHPDLFWALHGGGGNFGVVTTLEYELHEVGPALYAGLAAYDPADAREICRAFRDFHDGGGPDEAGLALVYLNGPPEEFIPPEWQGRLLFALAGCFKGRVDEGERVLRPLIEAAEPIADLFGPLPYVEFQCMIDDPPGQRNWWTADYLEAFPDDAIEAFCSYSERMPLSATQSLVAPWGGAVERRAKGWPLAKRDAKYVTHPFCVWDDPARDAEHIAWGREGREVFKPWASGGTYLNFIGDEGQERVRAGFGDAYERLAEVKAQYDPGNVFSGNQNILPAKRGLTQKV